MRPPLLDPTRRTRRVRALSAEEQALWDGVARSARPLRRPRKTGPDIDANANTDATPPDPAHGGPAPSVPATVPPPPRAEPPLSPLARRERARVARGRREIEARLDLHGLTLSRAHAALRRFLLRAQDDGLTLVLVITGKGGRDGKGGGVLRREVPEWLALPEFRGLVIGFEEAHAVHGGGGALYVRVRRARL